MPLSVLKEKHKRPFPLASRRLAYYAVKNYYHERSHNQLFIYLFILIFKAFDDKYQLDLKSQVLKNL